MAKSNTTEKVKENVVESGKCLFSQFKVTEGPKKGQPACNEDAKSRGVCGKHQSWANKFIHTDSEGNEIKTGDATPEQKMYMKEREQYLMDNGMLLESNKGRPSMVAWAESDPMKAFGLSK